MSWPEAVATVWITMTVCNYLENKENSDEGSRTETR